ncbi:MAG: hypothetical protein IM592_14375 [Bacteroidetes bacterium]|jgi:hypothetical protein|nr:hypothetical protein [Bacteroidota bacterium]
MTAVEIANRPSEASTFDSRHRSNIFNEIGWGKFVDSVTLSVIYSIPRLENEKIIALIHAIDQYFAQVNEELHSWTKLKELIADSEGPGDKFRSVQSSTVKKYAEACSRLIETLIVCACSEDLSLKALVPSAPMMEALKEINIKLQESVTNHTPISTSDIHDLIYQLSVQSTNEIFKDRSEEFYWIKAIIFRYLEKDSTIVAFKSPDKLTQPFAAVKWAIRASIYYHIFSNRL